jgi:hypothetical protein
MYEQVNSVAKPVGVERLKICAGCATINDPVIEVYGSRIDFAGKVRRVGCRGREAR